MSIETMTKQKEISFITLGDYAKGSIEAGPDQLERLDELTERLGTGEFHEMVDDLIPCGCIDGRCGCSMKPNSAGGTIGYLVADDLTTHRFSRTEVATIEGFYNVIEHLSENGVMVGGHKGPHLKNGETSDCGANDKLAIIYDYIAHNGQVLRQVSQDLGVNVEDSLHQQIIDNAGARQVFSKGAELLEALEDKASKSEAIVDDLIGDHKEVVAVVNNRYGTSLNRDKLAAEFGQYYESFNIDLWSFDNAAHTISETEDEARAKLVAMVYYNLATAMVLCGPSMRVLILE